MCTLVQSTVFIRIVAAATINFALSFVRLLIEGGSYFLRSRYVRLLFEGGYYSMCGYYSNKYGKSLDDDRSTRIHLKNR